MPERRGLAPHRTDRPEAVAAAVLPTIREVLRFDEVARSLPEILAGDDALDRPVRWVHVFETAQAARLVSGGELLLSTGVGWPTDDDGLRALAGQLVRDDIAGLILELGDRMPAAPLALVAEFRVAGLPFVVLHREVRFIAITEAVHARIIADQMVALRARDEIHALFTELSLRGSPADFIVAQAGRVLASPVVLEDLNHNVIAAETLGAADDALDDWEQRSRAAHREAGEGAGDGGSGGASGGGSVAGGSVSDGWLIVPVEARGIRWGHLIALPGDAHPAGRSNVLEQAAVALALSRLADRDDDEWTRQSHDRLLGALLGRRFASESGLVARFEAAGFAVTGRTLTGVAVGVRSAGSASGPGREGPRAAGSRPKGTHPGATAVVSAVLTAARDAGVDALAAEHPVLPDRAAGRPVVLALSGRHDRPLTDAWFAALGRAIALGLSVDENAVTLAVGSDAGGIPGLLASIEEAPELLDRGDVTRTRTTVVHRVERRPLLRLVNALASDPRMQEHSEHMLRPLIEYDLANGGDLLEVLRAYATHPGNRTRAAAASHLSRSVFYQRIALIEELLGMDLDDGETLSALHAALLARRVAG
ncbi:PucR family transcriptional regulator [Leifsonia sp. NPDC058248]|uniref:PucR family transcriptional regulator n=1 Tax=Leifsonia sp. NPDC058248 TaxID=3346402 RepID=UPI0036DF20F3